MSLPGIPDLTLSRDSNGFTVELTILGLAPSRNLSAEEILSGVVSLSPVVVQANSVEELFPLCIYASLNSIEATDGAVVNSDVISRLSIAVSYALGEALALLGEDGWDG